MSKLIWAAKAVTLLGLTAAVFGPAAYFAYELYVRPYQIPEEEVVVRAEEEDVSLPAFEKVQAVLKSRDWVAARMALENFIEQYPFSSKMEEAKRQLGEVNVRIFFTPIAAPEKIEYVIQRGDAVEKLRRRFKVTPEILMRCNNLEDPRRLSIGQRLYINQPEFSVVIDRKKKVVTLLNHQRFFKEYRPLAWNAPEPPRGAEKVPIQAKVRDKSAWFNGERVHFGAPEYAESNRWVEIVKGFTLYTEGGKKPDGGISFSPEDMDELSTLLSKNVPVSIQ